MDLEAMRINLRRRGFMEFEKIVAIIIVLLVIIFSVFVILKINILRDAFLKLFNILK